MTVEHQEREAEEHGIGTPEQLSHIVDIRLPFPPSAYLAPVGAKKE